MTVLELTDITVRARSRILLDHVRLRVGAGEFVALLGPNGAGKTTLLRSALGLVPPATGSVTVDGSDVRALSPRDRARALAWLPQQPFVPEPVPALEAVLAARYRFDETAAQAASAARRALARAGAAELAPALLSELSGGEKQRVALAALLAQEARVLLLDEPANHLDPAQQAETYALLGALAAEGQGILCVTHDVNLLAHVRVTPRVAGLRAGELRFECRHDAAELPLRLEELFGVRMHALEAHGRRIIVALPRDTEPTT